MFTISILLLTLLLNGYIEYRKNSFALMDFKEFLYKKMNTSLYGEWESNFSSDISLFSHHKGNAQLSIIGDQEEFMKSLFVKGIDK